jgi:hypothetical protein
MVFRGNDPTVTASGQVAAAGVGTTALIEVGAAQAGANPLAVVQRPSTKHPVARHKTKAAHHQRTVPARSKQHISLKHKAGLRSRHPNQRLSRLVKSRGASATELR